MRTFKSLMFALALCASMGANAVNTSIIDLDAPEGSLAHPMFITWPSNLPLPTDIAFETGGVWHRAGFLIQDGSDHSADPRTLYLNELGHKVFVIFLR